ncbi:tropomyosin alpha-1 chain-like [Ambystoma mexicanum]|uniref:tropomyosin alpha-1 chain-like n=1 Tax=Ambystoma mexicanum TaxID=8296 RepID=UPI0037E8808F
MDDESKRLKEQLDAVHKELRKVKNTVGRLKFKARDAQAQLTPVWSENAELRKQIRKLDDECLYLRQQLYLDLPTRKSEREASAAESEREASAAESEIQDLKKQLQKLKHDASFWRKKAYKGFTIVQSDVSTQTLSESDATTSTRDEITQTESSEREAAPSLRETAVQTERSEREAAPSLRYRKSSTCKFQK